MKTHYSISQKLLRDLLVPLCIMFVATSFIAYNLAAWFASDSYDQELLNAAHAVAARLTEDDEGLVAELPDAVQEVLRHNDQDNFYYQVLSTKHIRLAGDAVLPMPQGNTDTDTPSFRNSVLNGHPVRIARIRVPLHQKKPQVVIVQVARTLNARSQLIRKIFLSIVVPQIILGILSVFAVKRGVSDGLRPLLELSKDIQRRSQLDLKPIDKEDTPQEMISIVDALNGLFARIDTYISGQQRFVSNAAHQLRTPVAGLKAYIEYGRRIGNGKFNDVLDQLDSGTDRISELVAGLLLLARASDPQAHQRTPVELNDLSSEVTSELVRQAANKQVELLFQPSGTPSTVVGDKGQLRAMISNIVDNAIRYTPDGGQVSVFVQTGPPACISVQDNGPGIPKLERERVFERFYRVLGTRVNGSGLGLAIVDEIAQAHKATVQLLDPQFGRGTLVKVTFPEDLN